MGTIWLAHDELLDRQVAIKEVLLPQSLDPAARSEALQRTMREAMAAAQLRHPGIITIHDVLSEDGRPWIVMELLKGHDLKQAVAAEGPWAPERAADLGLRVLDALNAAHARGIQHRDVKPANVFLTDDGRVVLTDFGIARLADEATITASGLLVGSPGFIAPERLRGERGGPESDLWSLAATMYAAVEGRAPYVGTSPLSILREALTRPPDPPMRAGHLGPVLMAMMAREPYQRPGAQAAEQLLRRVAEGGQALAPPPAKRSNRVPILVGGGIVAVAAAAVAVVALMPGDKPNGPPKISGAAHPTQTIEKPTPTPTPTPTPSRAEEARFHAPVNLCRTLTAKQLAALVPGAPQGKRDGNSCEWTLRGIGLSIQALDVDKAPDPWSAELDPAKEEYVNKSNALSQSAKITWQWPEIGLKKGITQPRTHFKDLKGIGDEAFTYDLVNPKGQAEHVTVLFRVSNVNIEIDYVNVNRIGKGDTLSQGARGAARWVADRLNRSAE